MTWHPSDRLFAHLATSPTFEFRHEERDTGGTKFPRRIDIAAHHPETGAEAGNARYYPPKRKGGPLHIEEVNGHTPGAASALLNEIEARHPGSTTKFLYEVKRNNNNPDVTGHAHERAGKPSDWDTHYPNLSPTLYRGMSVRLPDRSARVVNSSAPREDHLRELHDALQSSSLGTHWTESEHSARLFAHNAVSDYRTDVPVVVHAKTPDRKDIETREQHLYRGGVFPYGDPHSKENEVPIRKGRSVTVTGISWRPDAPHPDADEHGWVHHSYAEHERPSHTAALHVGGDQPATGEPMAQELPHACSYCGHTEFEAPVDTGRGATATCSNCGGSMSSWGGQWTPELVGDPSNHPSPKVDPRSGAGFGQNYLLDSDGRSMFPDKVTAFSAFEITAVEAHTGALAPSGKGPVDWDTVGSVYPHVYGDPDVHGEAAEGADGWGIGDAANHLAHDRADDPGAENSTVHDLEFHPYKSVPTHHIDYVWHPPDDPRVQRAIHGYRHDPDSVPPLVLVHRHGVYHVADGHHRAAAAAYARVEPRALIAHSPHPDEPFSDGTKGPFHGAEPVDTEETPKHQHGDLYGHMVHDHGNEHLADVFRGRDSMMRDLHDRYDCDWKPGTHHTAMPKRQYGETAGVAGSHVWRGVHAPTRYGGNDEERAQHARAAAAATRRGELGSGMYGSGHYVATNPTLAVTYAQAHGADKTGVVLHGQISPHADVAHTEWAPPHLEPHELADWAREQGHDVLTNGAFHVVLNPHAVRWESKDYSTDEAHHRFNEYGDHYAPPEELHKESSLHRTADGPEQEYRLQHQAPDSDYGAPLHDVRTMMPSFYTHPHYYNFGEEDWHTSANIIRKARGNPEHPVRIYRTLPAEHADKGFNTGDWVGTSEHNVRQHAAGEKNWAIMSTVVPAKHLFTEGNSVHEWAYNGPPVKADRPHMKVEGKKNALDVTELVSANAVVEGGTQRTAEADWCTHRHLGSCYWPGDNPAAGVIPQRRGACNWTTAWEQQLCPMSDPGPMAGMFVKGRKESALLPVNEAGFRGFVERHPGDFLKSDAMDRRVRARYDNSSSDHHYPEQQPLPVGHHRELGNFKIDRQTDRQLWHQLGQIEDVDLTHGVYATQPYLVREHLRRYQDNPHDVGATQRAQEGGKPGWLNDYPGTHMPMFVRHSGNLFATDGHHRVGAALTRGEGSIKGMVYDADKHGFQNPWDNDEDIQGFHKNSVLDRPIANCAYAHDDEDEARRHAYYHHDDGICVRSPLPGAIRAEGTAERYLQPVKSAGFLGYVEGHEGDHEKYKEKMSERYGDNDRLLRQHISPESDEDRAVGSHPKLHDFSGEKYNYFWHQNGKVGEVDLSGGVYATQPYLVQEHVDRYTHNPHDKTVFQQQIEQLHEEDRPHTTYPGNHMPMFVRHEGNLYAMEGHHRVAAALRRGDSSIHGITYDFDTHENPAVDKYNNWGDESPNTFSKYSRRGISCDFHGLAEDEFETHCRANHDDGICVETEYARHLNGGGRFVTAASKDPELLFHFTATWADVRNKAKRIRREGGVRILMASSEGVVGEVRGDNNVYETTLTYVPGSAKVGTWNCGCRWAAYAWGRSPKYRRFEGRMCSHALAVQFEAQARAAHGRTIMPDTQRPEWLKQRTPVVIQHQRDKQLDLTRREVPPGNMRSVFGAVETPCHTPGSQYHTEIGDHQISVTVDLPPGIDISQEQAETLDGDTHNAMELVLAPLFTHQAFSAWEMPADDAGLESVSEVVGGQLQSIAADSDFHMTVQRAMDKARDEVTEKHQDDATYAENYEPLHKSDLPEEHHGGWKFHQNVEGAPPVANLFAELFGAQKEHQHQPPVSVTQYRHPVGREPLHLDEHGNSWRRHYEWTRPDATVPEFTGWSGPHSAAETLRIHPTWSTSQGEDGKLRQHQRTHEERLKMTGTDPTESHEDVVLRRNRNLREKGWGVVSSKTPGDAAVVGHAGSMVAGHREATPIQALAAQLVEDGADGVAVMRELLGLGMPHAAAQRLTRTALGLTAASICPECHGPVAPHAVSCPHCGARLMPSDVPDAHLAFRRHAYTQQHVDEAARGQRGRIPCTSCKGKGGHEVLRPAWDPDSPGDSDPESYEQHERVKEPCDDCEGRGWWPKTTPQEDAEERRAHDEQRRQRDDSFMQEHLQDHAQGKVPNRSWCPPGCPIAKQGAKHKGLPSVAGVVLKALDTGRILMLQRGLDDQKDPARGTWEFPGGHIEDGDVTTLHAAIREWQEEVGQQFPEGGAVVHSWVSPNGIYAGYVVLIPSEKDVSMRDGRVVVNPDDPKGDHHEQAAWWDVAHAKKNPALRPECKTGTPWREIERAGEGMKAARREVMMGFGPLSAPGPEQNINPFDFAFTADIDEDRRKSELRYTHEQDFLHKTLGPEYHPNDFGGAHQQPWGGVQRAHDDAVPDEESGLTPRWPHAEPARSGWIEEFDPDDPAHHRDRANEHMNTPGGVPIRSLNGYSINSPLQELTNGLPSEPPPHSNSENPASTGFATSEDPENWNDPGSARSDLYVASRQEGYNTWRDRLWSNLREKQEPVPQTGHLYRVMSDAEMQTGREKGAFHSPDGEGLFVTDDPDRIGRKGGDYGGHGGTSHIIEIDPSKVQVGERPSYYNRNLVEHAVDRVPMHAVTRSWTWNHEAKDYLPSDAHRTAMLHDEPEPALPSTDGDREAPLPPGTPMPQREQDVLQYGYDDLTEFREDHPEQRISTESAFTSTALQGTATSLKSAGGGVAAIVAAFQQTAGAQALATGTPKEDQMDIASAARQYLAGKTAAGAGTPKTALKNFNHAEQQALINEGADGVTARNLSDLQIEGTHYSALEAALREQEDNGVDPAEIFIL